MTVDLIQLVDDDDDDAEGEDDEDDSLYHINSHILSHIFN